ncbi:M48 family metalloprotease [Acinetobacter pittii]|uniref:M48 family metalloprotease n=1 Tax=Acinetobacter pittii TaxID=48296 RepID=UPI00300897CC
MPIILSTAFITNASYAQPFDPQPSANQVEIPNIGSGIGLLDQQKEKFIGEKVFREVHKQMPVIQDVWLEDQFFQVFSSILSETQLGQPIGLVVIKDPQINAFAVPGGLFALNTGLIASARNIDEIAGVMAHEIAHVSQRHFSRSEEAFKGQTLLSLAGLLAGVAIAAQGGGDAGAAVMLGTQAALMDKQLTYSRNQEREADRIGMQYMYAAGYNPQSMADYFETMHRATSRVSFLPDFWLTHPLTTERMSEARLRANQMPRVKNRIYDADFEILKWYTMVVANQATENQLQSLASQKNIAGLIALAAFYTRQGDYVQAQSTLDQAKASGKPLVTLLQTDIYLGQNKLDQAYTTIASTQMTMPENKAFSYKLAEVLLRQGKFAQVQTLVQRFINKNPRDIQGWQFLQQAANLDKNGPLRAVNVLRYRAEAEYWSGSEENAIKSMLHAQRLAKDNQAMLARIDSRLKQMQDERRMKI